MSTLDHMVKICYPKKTVVPSSILNLQSMAQLFSTVRVVSKVGSFHTGNFSLLYYCYTHGGLNMS